MSDALEIPPEYEPNPAQIPVWATDLDRFRICFAMTRAIAHRDDPVFTKQLYDGDIDTGDALAPPHPDTDAGRLRAQQSEHD